MEKLTLSQYLKLFPASKRLAVKFRLKNQFKISLLILFTLSIISCEYETTDFNNRTLKSNTFITPQSGDLINTDIEVIDNKGNTTVYTSKLTIICINAITPTHWKGVAKDDNGYYYDIESTQQSVIINGKLQTVQITKAKLSKLQYPYTPNC